jgi:hypothetical protein
VRGRIAAKNENGPPPGGDVAEWWCCDLPLKTRALALAKTTKLAENRRAAAPGEPEPASAATALKSTRAWRQIAGPKLFALAKPHGGACAARACRDRACADRAIGADRHQGPCGVRQALLL